MVVWLFILNQERKNTVTNAKEKQGKVIINKSYNYGKRKKIFDL
ncbi:hypothetical protein FHX64_001699 [Microbacter margulisiae]|uniref:Uncharacterized protein n=1 Tax=Microbacter margulisiae TaxID=1350067 RepID=A0A7W5H2K5_9PORP|nr:hypothetical protein [Microbacter margulisiae]